MFIICQNEEQLLVKLISGVRHQLRIQFSQRGHSLVGDDIYGKANLEDRLHLHAFALEITHPKTHKKMWFSENLPNKW